MVETYLTVLAFVVACPLDVSLHLGHYPLVLPFEFGREEGGGFMYPMSFRIEPRWVGGWVVE